MAADFILLNTSVTTATRAQAAKNAVNQFRSAKQALESELAIMNHLFVSGSPPDFTAMETQYGLQAGQGQTLFNLFNGTIGAFAGTFQNDNANLLVAQVG